MRCAQGRVYDTPGTCECQQFVVRKGGPGGSGNGGVPENSADLAESVWEECPPCAVSPGG